MNVKTPLAAHARLDALLHAATSNVSRKAICGAPLDINATVRAGSRPFASVGAEYACGRCQWLVENGAA